MKNYKRRRNRQHHVSRFSRNSRKNNRCRQWFRPALEALEDRRLLATLAEIGINDFRISDAGGTGDPTAAAFWTNVAYNSTDNEYLVIWQADDTDVPGIVDGEFEIFGRIISGTDGSTIVPDFRISDAGTPGNSDITAAIPSVAYNSTDNEYLVVWYADDNEAGLLNNELDIFGQRLDADGNEIGPNDFRISDAGGTGGDASSAAFPSVAYNANDNEYLVVWKADDTDTAGIVVGEDEVFGQLLDANGNEIGTNDFRISDAGGSGNNSIDVFFTQVAHNSADNEYLVVWQADDTDTAGVLDREFEIFGQRLDAAGNEVGNNDFRISDAGGSGDIDIDAQDPRVVYNPTANEYLVVWYADDTDVSGILDDETEVFGQRLDAAGNEIGTNDFRISEAGGTGSAAIEVMQPRVAYSITDNEYLVIWAAGHFDLDAGIVDVEFQIFGQQLDQEGNEIGEDDFQISDAESAGFVFGAGDPGVIHNPAANEFLAVWSANDTGTDGIVAGETEVFGQRLGRPNVHIMDDGDTRFDPGGFTRLQSVRNPHGYVGDDGIMEEHYSQANSGNIATWTFTVTPGVYRVSANWVPHPNRATNSAFRVFDGPASGTPVAGRDINQQPAPDDFMDAGAPWEDIAQAVVITGTTLTVSLADFATNGFVIADAVRIERDLQPEIELTDLTTGNPIADGGTVAIGSVLMDVPTSRNFRISNLGSGDLNVSDVSINNTTGSVFSLMPDPDPVGGTGTIAFGGSADFTIALNTSVNGTFAATVTVTSNDADEGTFTFDVTATVDTRLVVDDGDLLRFDAGGFTRLQSIRNPHGFVGDDGIMEEHYSEQNDGNSATWSFTVTPGMYRVSANWVEHANRATNSPFSVFDGPATGTPAATGTLNQRLAPDDFSDGGVFWEDIAVLVQINGTQLTVGLGDTPTNGFVIADAIRIERIPDPPPIAPSAPLAKAAAPLAANTAAELPEAVAVDLVAANSATASPAVAKTIRKGDSSAAPTRAARTDLVAGNSALLSSRIFDDDDEILVGIADEGDSRRDEEFVDQLFADLVEEAGDNLVRYCDS